MRIASRFSSFALAIFLLLLVTSLGACHSYHIETTVTNKTGGPISLLEVDYPSASFGADSLAAGADFHHRIQTRGDGSIKVQYTAANGKQIQMTGPTLYERQEGRIDISLLPDGKVEFQPSLRPQH